MNFDISWFTTIPGLFITGGVILLIIALVILIITNKKAKQEKAAANGETPATNPVAGVVPGPVVPGSVPGVVAPTATVGPVGPTVQPQSVVTPVDPMAVAQATMPAGPSDVVQPVMPESVPAVPGQESITSNPMMVSPQVANGIDTSNQPPVIDPNVVGMPETVVAEQNVAFQPAMPEVASTNQEMVAQPVGMVDSVSTMPSISTPSMVTEQAPIVVPEVAPTPVVDAAVVEQPGMPQVNEVNVQPTVEAIPVATEAAVNVNTVPATEPVIYGGASPVVSDININQEANHQIYGGADPLQNTQNIPSVAPIAPAPVEVQNVEPVMVTPQVVPTESVAPVTMPEVPTIQQ